MANSKKIVSVMVTCILALLATGCSDSNPVAIDNTVVDTAPPALPDGLASIYEKASGTAVISWDVNTVDTDLAGYLVTRANDGLVVDLISTPALVQSVLDTDPQLGLNLYSVYAVDLVGNVSAAQTILLTVAGDHAPAELHCQ